MSLRRSVLAAAASMIAMVPALLLMVFGQRYVVRGLTIGAIK